MLCMTLYVSLAFAMADEKIMISARLPVSLVARVDFVARNTDDGPVKNRSTAMQAAVETWLQSEETKLEARGLLQKKARS